MGAMVKAEVDEIRSHDGTVQAEVDAGEQYVCVIARAPKKGQQNAAVFRSSDPAALALVVFDEDTEDDPLSVWEEEGWELVLFARPL